MMTSLSKHQVSFEQIYSTHPLFLAISKRQFDEHGLAYKSLLHKHYWWWTFENIYTLLDLRESDRLLNIGVGFGFDEKVIKSRLPNIEIYGIDIAPSMIRGALLNESPAELAVATAEHLPFGPHSFTRVISREVIEHVFDPVRFLEEIRRVAATGTRIVITTPNASSLALSHILQKVHLNSLVYRGHHHKDEHRTTEDLEKLFSSAGFEVQERFFDCAGYFWLSSIFATPLRPLALFMAKLTRVLEGNDYLSRTFCDQVKYVLVCKPGTNKLEDSEDDDLIWACPTCNGHLVNHEGDYECTSCHATYPLLEGKSPIFTTDEVEPASSPSKKLRSPNLIIKAVILIFYSSVYGTLLLLGAGFAKLLGIFGRSAKPGLKLE